MIVGPRRFECSAGAAGYLDKENCHDTRSNTVCYATSPG